MTDVTWTMGHDQKVEALRAMRSKSMTLREIAEAFSTTALQVSPAMVSDFCNRHSVDRIPIAVATQAEDQMMLAYDSGLPKRLISAQYDINLDALNAIAARRGLAHGSVRAKARQVEGGAQLKCAAPGERRPRKISLSNSERSEALLRFVSGDRLDRISADFKLSPDWIEEQAAAAGLRPAPTERVGARFPL